MFTFFFFFFFQAEDGIRDSSVTGVQTCALPISEISGFWQPEYLAGIDALGIADLAEISRVDDQIAGADAVAPPGYLPQIGAGLHGIGLPRRQLPGGSLRQGHEDVVHRTSDFP